MFFIAKNLRSSFRRKPESSQVRRAKHTKPLWSVLRTHVWLDSGFRRNDGYWIWGDWRPFKFGAL